jgi:hypothetical protein
MGLVCVHAVPVAEGTLLTVCTVDDGEWRTKADTPDHFLFRTEQDLNKIIDEMVTLEAMFWTASRVEGGVLLNVAVDRIADVIAECLKWQRTVRLVTGAEIELRLASVEQEIERQLVRRQTSGSMKSPCGP